MTKLSFQNSGRTAEILLYGDIGDYDDGIGANDLSQLLASFGSLDRLTIGINSQGGDVCEGVAIFNLLANYPAHVITRVDALAASAASVILMAGDEIQAAENSIVMVHKAWCLAAGNCDGLRDTAAVLDKVDGQLVTTYARRTGLTASKVATLMAAETWMTASEAKALGFVDSVVTASRMSAKFDAKRFKNVPNWAAPSGNEPSRFPLADAARQKHELLMKRSRDERFEAIFKKLAENRERVGI